MRNRKAILFFILFGSFIGAFAQSVTISTIDAGPYGVGSSIAVSVTIDDVQGKLKTNNVFKLYISDASSGFTNPIEIGTYPGFYTTFINGVIPAGLTPGDYKVVVKYADETLVSEASNSFKVIASSGVKADIDANALQKLSESPKTFGVCKPETRSTFRFTNSSTAGADVSVIVTNEVTAASQIYNFNQTSFAINAEMAHYTLFVKASLNGTVGTKAFFLINNVIKPGFSAPANSTVCLPAELQYDIETKSINGIQNNFPGYSYQVNWGDGAVEDITPNNILASDAQIKHTYTKSSCGRQIKINDVNYYNVYGIIYQVNSPYCGLVSVPISTQSKVLNPPVNRLVLDSSVCVNSEVSILNRSIAGDNPSATSAECVNKNNVYYWFVDDVPVTPQGVPISYDLKHTFTTSGFHKVRLESQSFSSCEASAIEKTVYVQTTTLPDFNLSETQACVGATIKATDNSLVDPNQSAKNIYKWEVTGPAVVAFVNGTSGADKNPEFTFNEVGVYTIKLTIISPCNPSIVEKTVIINKAPTIAAEWQASLCGKGQLITFDESTENPMKIVFTGTAQPEPGTYRWDISGGVFSFKNNTTENSKSPSILFEDYGTYIIVITHRNNCGTSVVTKTILFNEAPTVFAGADQTVCANSEVALDGSIVGDTENTFSWLGGEGLFIPSRNTLNPIYKPSPQEILAGKVQLRLSVNTKNAAPCNLVEDLMLIKITPENKITSVAIKDICTATAVNYTPTAILSGSTFTWTVTTAENASGFAQFGNGIITDVLSCVKPNEEASVTYLIVPHKDGCNGEPFELKVSVKPTPKITAIASDETICSGKEVAIILTANFPDVRYTWTSTVTGKISGNSQNTSPKAITEILDKLTNTGGNTGSVTYNIVPENATGCTEDTVAITINVSASAGITTFSPDKTTGCSPLKVAFKNSTIGSQNIYHWDFGDGQTLVTTDNNTVNHTYVSNVAKKVVAKLITETDCGSYNSEFTISIQPNTVEPELVVNGDEYEGCAPHTVKFFNNSKGAVFFTYDFGDGTILEGNQSPQTISHTFTEAGTYVVKLTASNGCSDTTTTETIKIFPHAISSFSSEMSGTCDSVVVKFKNESVNAVAYLWDFGDGIFSTDKNPTHLFRNEKASYNVSLISYSSFGCGNTLQKTDYIRVGANPNTDFVVSPGLTIQYPNFRFTFKNSTDGEMQSYLWDFGDGSSSTDFDAEHSYPDTGTYKVKLTATNRFGCSNSISKTIKILGVPGNLFIPNAFMPNSLVEEIRTFRAKGSGMADWHFRIFNKWGQLVWQTNQLDEKGRPTESWDGTMFGQKAPQGIYFWEAEAKFINGTEWPGMSYKDIPNPKKAGTLNLIR